MGLGLLVGGGRWARFGIQHSHLGLFLLLLWVVRRRREELPLPTPVSGSLWVQHIELLLLLLERRRACTTGNIERRDELSTADHYRRGVLMVVLLPSFSGFLEWVLRRM